MIKMELEYNSLISSIYIDNNISLFIIVNIVVSLDCYL